MNVNAHWSHTRGVVVRLFTPTRASRRAVYTIEKAVYTFRQKQASTVYKDRRFLYMVGTLFGRKVYTVPRREAVYTFRNKHHPTMYRDSPFVYTVGKHP